jgi:hypothetical protein
MVLTVLSGLVILNPNSNEPIYLPAGFTATCHIADISEGNCLWTDGEPYSAEIQEVIDIIRQIFELSPNLFNYLASPPHYVCASGVGEVECEFIFDNPGVDLALAQQICPLIDTPVCDLLFPQ